MLIVCQWPLQSPSCRKFNIDVYTLGYEDVYDTHQISTSTPQCPKILRLKPSVVSLSAPDGCAEQQMLDMVRPS